MSFLKKYNFTLINIFWNLFIALFMVIIFHKNGTNEFLDFIKENFDFGFYVTFIPFLLFLLTKIIFNYIDGIEKSAYLNEVFIVLSSLIIPTTLYFLGNKLYTLPSSLFSMKVSLLTLILVIWISYLLLNIFFIKKKLEGISKKYIIRKSLVSDINASYIWSKDLPCRSREIVKITNMDNKKSIWCEVMVTSENYIKRYNNNPNTINLDSKPFFIANAWYRKELGLEQNKEFTLKIDTSYKPLFLKQLLSSRKHPDNTIRLASNLAFLSLLLGILGLILGCISLLKT